MNGIMNRGPLAVPLALIVVFSAFIASLTIPALSQGDELILFADDQYKAVGAPDLRASLINTEFKPGTETTLRLVLANNGLIQGLIPTGLQADSEDVAARERREEMRAADAMNIVAVLEPPGQVEVLSPEISIPLLPAGKTIILEFPVRINEDAAGGQDLLLDLSYEHQVDVRISGDEPSPLYLPGNVSQNLRIEVVRPAETFRADLVESSLSPGKNGSVTLVIRNTGSSSARNCSAVLNAAVPFNASRTPVFLGEILPGGVALASFWVQMDGAASPGEYQLTCEIMHDGGPDSLAFPVTVGDGGPASGWIVPGLMLLAMISGISILLWGIRTRSGGRGKRFR